MKAKLVVLFALLIASVIISGCGIRFIEAGGDLAFLKRACTPGADDHLMVERYWRLDDREHNKLYYAFYESFTVDGKRTEVQPLRSEEINKKFQYQNVEYEVRVDTIRVPYLSANFKIDFPQIMFGNPQFPNITYAGNINGVRVFQDRRNELYKRFFDIEVPQDMTAELIIEVPYDLVTSDECGFPLVIPNAGSFLAKFILIFDG